MPPTLKKQEWTRMHDMNLKKSSTILAGGWSLLIALGCSLWSIADEMWIGLAQALAYPQTLHFSYFPHIILKAMNDFIKSFPIDSTVLCLLLDRRRPHSLQNPQPRLPEPVGPPLGIFAKFKSRTLNWLDLPPTRKIGKNSPKNTKFW